MKEHPAVIERRNQSRVVNFPKSGIYAITEQDSAKFYIGTLEQAKSHIIDNDDEIIDITEMPEGYEITVYDGVSEGYWNLYELEPLDYAFTGEDLATNDKVFWL